MTRISRPRAFLLCAIPALSPVLLAPTTVVPVSSGRTPGDPAGASAMESPVEPGVPALFSWADYDGDGRLDIAAVNADGALRLLLNAGEGRFEDVTERVGLFDIEKAALALWADYDGDGRLDLFVGAREGASRLFHNDYGVFVDVSARSGFSSEGAVESAQWLDGDGDGLLDLFVVTAKRSQFFRGVAGGFFKAADLPSVLSTGMTGATETQPGAGALPRVGETTGERTDADIDDNGGRKPGSVLDGRRAIGGAKDGVTSSTLPPGGQIPAIVSTPCVLRLADVGVPGACISASSTPTLGRLYPISTNLFVAVGGDVGIGTTTPGAKLDVAGSLVLSAVAPHSLKIRNGPTEVAELGVAFQANQFSFWAQANDAVLRNMAPGKSIHIQSGNGGAAVTIDGSNLVGIGTPTPGAKLDVAGTARITDTLTLNPSGDVALDVSTGSIYMGGVRFIHHPGTNTVIGSGALASVTSGGANTAVGLDALNSNTTGFYNTASGRSALESNMTGHQNTASGNAALADNTSGSGNTAVGSGALRDNTSGDDNIGIGAGAGSSLTTGHNNIAIGNDLPGLAGESGTIRIGRDGTHTKTFIQGIFGVTTDIANGFSVRVDSNGQLGTTSSSRRFKKDIADMGHASDRLLELRPVVFHYKQKQTLPNGGEVPLEYGLIAEEVAEIMPGLVIYDEDGQPFTVKYDLLSSMLLNELKKLNERCVGHEESTTVAIEQLQSQNENLLARVARLESVEAEVASLKASLQALLDNR